MSDIYPKYYNQLEQDSHDNGANFTVKRVALFGWNSSTLQYERLLSTGGVLQTSGAGGGGSSSITSFLGLTTAGQQLMAASVPVTVASDQSALPVKWGQFELLKKTVLTTPQAVSGNATMAYDGANTIYLYVPASVHSQIYSYNFITGALTALTNGTTLDEAYSGAALLYANGKLYFTRGGGFSTFYRINTDGTSFTTLTACSTNINFGCAMLYDGNDTIYLANAIPGFQKYSIAGNSWTALTATPWTGTEGLSICLLGTTKIWAMQGAGSTGFAVYDISGNAWTSKAATPANVYDGGALAWNGSDSIYAFGGNGSQNFWKYTIASNSWTSLAELPVPSSTGSTFIAKTDGTFIAYIAEPSNLTGYGSVNNLYYYDPGQLMVTTGAEAANGAVIPGKGLLTGGSDGANFRAFNVDGNGILNAYAVGSGGVKLQQEGTPTYASKVALYQGGNANASGNPIFTSVTAVAGNVTVVQPTAANLNAVAFGWDGTTNRALSTDTSGRLSLGASSQAIGVVDTELPAAAALSDAFANPTAPAVGSFAMGFNSTTWERLRADLGDGSVSTGLQNIVPMMYNGASYDRVRGDTTNGLFANVKAIAAGSNIIGKVGIDQTTLGTTNAVQTIAGTTGGTSIYHAVSAASTNAANVKAGAGLLYGWYIYNSNAAARKVALYNTAGTPTVGTGVVMSIVIPPTSGANVFTPQGISFATGIGISMTTGLADSDATAVAANDLIVNLFYK